MITHSITSCQCVERQDDFYHKCHRCLYSGKLTDFVLADGNGELQNGVVAPAWLRRPVEPLVEIPGRNGVPAEDQRRVATDPAVPVRLGYGKD